MIIITILGTIHRAVLYLKHNISETGFYLRLQEVPTLRRQGLALSVGTTEYVPLGDGDKIQSQKCCILNKTQDDG
jgi:hypothetical protein